MGPVDRMRAAPAAALIQRAQALATDAGVTRLADITRLDGIGLPVWQAVRPMSRALSVHQGKGASIADAKLGALLEAAESDAAERLEATGPRARWSALDPAVRPSSLSAFLRRPDRAPPTAVVDWTKSHTHDGAAVLIPFDCVSLDFTRTDPSPFKRASAGLATGSSVEEAQRTALHELIERDALAAFMAADMFARLALEIRPTSIVFDWFAALTQRIERLGGELRIFHLPSVTRSPAFAASIRDRGKDARPYRAIIGHAAHPDPEMALFKAVAEAAQSRLTYIAGARDDCLPSQYLDPQKAMNFALAPPPNAAVRPMDFHQVQAGPGTVDALVDALAGAGAGHVLHVPIAHAHGFAIHRSFVPGLASRAGARQ